MKANKIYLERLRKNDFEDRSSESNIVFKPMTLEDFARHLHNLTKNLPKPNFHKGGIEFVNPNKKHWTENL